MLVLGDYEDGQFERQKLSDDARMTLTDRGIRIRGGGFRARDAFAARQLMIGGGFFHLNFKSIVCNPSLNLMTKQPIRLILCLQMVQNCTLDSTFKSTPSR
jgi:hypothetical protein